MELPKRTEQKLNEKTKLIRESPNPTEKDDQLYKNIRSSKWFEPVLETLRRLAGKGSRCMYCSGSESSDVDHYCPKSLFPELAFTWNNLLWSCTICNRTKGNRFSTKMDEKLINPLEECVWNFFYLDAFGNLNPKWRIDLDAADPRAIKTVELLGLDRQVLQESRLARRNELLQKVQDSLTLYHRGELSFEELRNRRSVWLESPFQPDVADFYLNGPGQEEKPFKQFTELMRS